MNGRRVNLTAGLTALAVGSSLACATQGGGRVSEFAAPVAAADIDYSVFLIGDAGHALAGDRTMARVTEFVAQVADRATVIFLGDNVYPAGLPDMTDPYRPTAERILAAQLDVVRLSGARGIVIPGNHDWAHGKADGWDAIRRQEAFVEAYSSNLSFLPDGGCPGPEVVDLGQWLRVIVVDTQWWFQAEPKPVDPTSTCPTDAPDEIVAAIQAALDSAGARHTLVIGHHPIATVGKHGGYFSLEDHLFPLRHLAKWLWVPLPIIGSVYPALRNLGVNPQDVSSGTYKRMIRAMREAFRSHTPLAYAGGHDHTLQVLEEDAVRYVLVSGAGPSSGLGAVGWNDRTLFARGVCGFMRLDVLHTGRVRLGVYETCPELGFRETYSRWLTEPRAP